MKETINFREFMEGTWREKKAERKSIKNFAIIPAIPKLMFFNEPVLTIATIGAGLIIITFAQKHLVKNGKEAEAEMLQLFATIGLPTAVGIYFFYTLDKIVHILL